jgi:hypothetical protein
MCDVCPRAERDFLDKLLRLRNGVPSHDTFSSVVQPTGTPMHACCSKIRDGREAKRRHKCKMQINFVSFGY